MKYLNKIQGKMLILIISLIITPQMFAQTSKSFYAKVNSLRTPVIQTDKTNYQPGEMVDIAGVEFLNYERVNINVSYFDKNLQQELLLSNWDVYADGKGRIAGEWQVYDVGDSGTRFMIEATGTISGASSKTEISTEPLAGEALTMEQCANTNGSPQVKNCDGSSSTGWVGGAVVASKAKYFEGDSLPYRARMSNLIPGTVYQFTIKYDTSKSTKNALDYLTTYNQTITDAEPCRNSGTANDNGFCTSGPPTSTIGIPMDPVVKAGRDTILSTTDDITQVPGVFSLWGGNLTATSAYTYTGDAPWTGTAETAITVTFTQGAGTTAVLSWAGHIASRFDWGAGNSASSITGSPYHTSNGGLLNTNDSTTVTGSQDLGLQAAAVTAPARITIVKQASPPTEAQSFGFTASGGLVPASFSLVDDDADGMINGTVGTNPAFNPSLTFGSISAFGTYTFTETTFGVYNLTTLSCATNAGAPTHVVNFGSRAVSVTVASGDAITCTWVNSFTTAAAVSVSGRVFDSRGYGLPRAHVTVTDANGTVRSATTNSFGHYRIDQIEAGEGLVFNVWNKAYTFRSQFINVGESLENVNFYPE